MANPFDRRRRRRSWLRFLVTIAVGWTIIVLMLAAFERSLIYFPSRYPDGFWSTEALSSSSGCRVSDCYFRSEDHVQLHGWLCDPPERLQHAPTAAMVLLWFHGNAGNLSHRGDMMARLATVLPARVFLVDYRGYGRSEGSKPSEQGLYRDGKAAWDYLVEERQVPAEQIVIFGKSLGGAVAVNLAAGVEPAGLIVQSSFTSVPDMARRHYPFIPRILIRTSMDSLSKIRGIRCPKLFVHGTADEVVPFEHGRRLLEAAPEPKLFHEVPGATHNTTFGAGGPAYFDALRDFISQCTGQEPAGSL